MMVRCGACRSQFDVPGPGRFACPVCGSVNVVRQAGGQPPPPGYGFPGGMPGGPGTQPPPPEPETPSPRITCPECEFRFIVGDIAIAVCPNCGSEVPTGRGESNDSEAV